jgi:hypothetical protein
MKWSYLVVWGATGLALACGTSIRRSRTESGSAAVIVLDESTLAQLSGSSVLDAIKLRLPQVRTFATTGGCPGVLLRGPDRMMGTSNPDVYVDHSHMLDTCILAALRATDLRRVEVYPLGVTSRPGYTTGAHGLILIFTLGSLAK